MRAFLLFTAAVLLGAFASHAQDAVDKDALRRDITALRERLVAFRAARGDRPGGALEVRIYDVRDLVGARVHAPPYRETIVRPSKYAPPEFEQHEHRGGYEVDTLVDLVRTVVDPESWDMLEGAEIQPKNNRLFIRTIPRVHTQIAAFLKHLHASRAPALATEIVAVRADPEFAQRLLARPHALTEEDRAAVARLETLGRLHVTQPAGHTSVRRAGRRFRYVADYEVEIAEGAVIADPVSAELFDGVQAQIAAAPAGHGAAVVHLRLERTHAYEPRRVETEHGDLELPQLDLTRVNASFAVPLGRQVVAGGTVRGDRACLFLVTVRAAER